MSVQAPILPWEVVVNNAGWFIDDLPEGGKMLKLVPLLPTPQGNVPVGQAFSVVFSAEGWERFQRDVAAGRISPVVLPVPGVNGNGGAP